MGFSWCLRSRRRVFSGRIALMHTWIYKGVRKQNTYLYLTAKDNFERVPQALLQLLGELVFVLDITLTKERHLHHAEVEEVMRQLDIAGYYLQLPPGDYVSKSIA